MVLLSPCCEGGRHTKHAYEYPMWSSKRQHRSHEKTENKSVHGFLKRKKKCMSVHSVRTLGGTVSVHIKSRSLFNNLFIFPYMPISL